MEMQSFARDTYPQLPTRCEHSAQQFRNLHFGHEASLALKYGNEQIKGELTHLGLKLLDLLCQLLRT